MLLVIMASAPAAPLSHGASVSGAVMKGQIYRYILKENRNPAVCRHMLGVFNDNFSSLWAERPLTWKHDPAYSADGKYSLPLLPGVKYSKKATYVMRFSVQPTSPEFSAIHWEEGTAVLGGCSACSWDHVPFPIMVAHLDIDNDGTTDTVIKQQFFRGYRHARDSMEYLTVWRNQALSVSGVVDIGRLDHPKSQALVPIIVTGIYLRPFIYAKRVYVARYTQDLGLSDDSTAEPEIVPWTQPPTREDMLVQQYVFTGEKEKVTDRPVWTIRTICDFQMKQLNN